MGYAIMMFLVLAVLFTAALALVGWVYQSGHRIYGTLVGFASFILLIVGQAITNNRIALIAFQVVFLFGCIVFFMAATKNYKLFMAGEGKGWLANRVRKMQALSKNHPH